MPRKSTSTTTFESYKKGQIVEAQYRGRKGNGWFKATVTAVKKGEEKSAKVYDVEYHDGDGDISLAHQFIRIKLTAEEKRQLAAEKREAKKRKAETAVKVAAQNEKLAKKKKTGAITKGGSKVMSHTDDGTIIVNASMAQIRKGLTGKAQQQLVRIPQVGERSKFYAEAAKVIGEREAVALPYHGGRMWKCEIKVSDANGACGDNRPKGAGGGGGKKSAAKNDNDGEEKPKQKKTNYKSLTPLFRWYRGSLILATLPYILDDIVEVKDKMAGKKRWANGMSDDELDSSDEEWDDEMYKVEPTTKMTMESSALTISAYEDSSHPMPNIARSWISPDLQRFSSRKSAMEHAQVLMKRDQLIDRTMFGYGQHGARLRPVKPTRKQALEAGMVRFLRDGLWIVGQEEAWIEKRRDILVKKQEKRKMIKPEEVAKGECNGEGEKKEAAQLKSPPVDAGKKDAEEQKKVGEDNSAKIEEMKVASTDASSSNKDDMKQASIETVDAMLGSTTKPVEEKAQDDGLTGMAAAASCPHPQLASMVHATSPIAAAASVATDAHPQSATLAASNQSTTPVASKAPVRNVDAAKIVSEASDASTEGVASDQKAKPSDGVIVVPEKAVVKRNVAPKGTRPPPAFTPSTHYHLNQDQITKCFDASLEFYDKVMNTVKARSLNFELADGFDVFRERGRGRYDMELPEFDTEAFSFLTDLKKAAWMPIVHKILGDDPLLIHKGCFLSLPGAENQVYHQDGLHLNKRTHKPCYSINVFIPLVDYDMTNGPTEFCLGTHYLGYENYVKENVFTPIVTAGTPVIFDYRLGHRGLGNNSQKVRPVVYLTYSSSASGKEFRDSVNFSRKYFRKLGELVDAPMSRGDRAKKRRYGGDGDWENAPAATDVTPSEQQQFSEGATVSIQSRTWPGINKPGGIAHVTKVHKEGEATKYDVAYVMGGSEKQVDACYVGLPQE